MQMQKRRDWILGVGVPGALDEFKNSEQNLVGWLGKPGKSPSSIGNTSSKRSMFHCHVSLLEGTWRIIPGLVSGDRITPIYKP